MKLRKVGISLLAATLLGLPQAAMSVNTATAETNVMQQQDGTVSGVVKDSSGEPVFGAIVFVVGTTNSTMADMDGNYKLDRVRSGATVRAQMMGFTTVDKVWNGGVLNFVLDEESTQLDEMVVTAMGIVRKEKSLTYSTQQIKADDIMKVQDMNLVNSLEGKISGITITPSAGGAGGASKITLRGNKSIMGDNAPLIVVDGVPMTNSVRGQMSDGASLTEQAAVEGSDPLSMINPDDIESMNVLKGANAAALYGSRAANGVLMITTKKGKEGKMEVAFNSNTTFETPLLTPKLQNSYGGYRAGTELLAPSLKYDSWGDRLSGSGNHILNIAGDKQYFKEDMVNSAHLRNYASDDVDEFFEWGMTTNNSISVSGGTEKIQTYMSYSNSHSNGMIESNKYNRNTFAFRQNYKLWEDRVNLGVTVNYIQAKSENRVGGGTVGNPIYHLYLTPRDVDMDYYKDNYRTEGEWYSSGDVYGNGTSTYYVKEGDKYVMKTDGKVLLSGPMQQYAFLGAMYNNPYWLTNQNNSESVEDRFSTSFQGTVKILEGLNFQARVSLDYTKYKSESKTYATTFYNVGMYRYGNYYLNNSRSTEIYTDYLLSYNKQLSKDWSISATAGYVGHTIKGENFATNIWDAATVDMVGTGIPAIEPGEPLSKIFSTVVNRFDPSSGYSGASSKSKSSNWDQALLFTGQVGWQDKVFVDFSYRQDWYRPFKQFEYLGTDDNYGYFGFGGNAIISDLLELPKWWSYAKFRMSYSEVGNSIPNSLYNTVSMNEVLGSLNITSRNRFTPEPEKTKSFETGLEMQFLRDCLNVDITYYNSAMHNSYLEIAGTNGKMQPVNSGIIRNQGIELSVGYDWKINRDWRWKTNMNFSYNYNEIERTAVDKYGNSKDMTTSIANGKIQVLYRKGGSYGDIYVTDFTRWKNNVYVTYTQEPSIDRETGEEIMIDVPHLNTTGEGELLHKAGDIYITTNEDGTAAFKHGGYADVTEGGNVRVREANKKYQKYAGNLNSKYQLSWSNTFTYKDFSLYFLINGRIGGKVISLTEGYLDRYGASERSGNARLYAEQNDLYLNGRHAMYVNDGRDLVAVEDYYNYLGSNDVDSYIYDATNFRLRELSLGYTFRNLFGDYKNLSLSFVCRNLFFIYKDSPVDPDVSLSTANSLGGIDMFNMPSARSYGFNLKLNL